MSQTENPIAVQPSKVNAPEKSENGGHSDEHSVPTDLKMPSGFAIAIAVTAFALLLVVLLILGYLPKHREDELARKDAETRAGQLPVVQFTNPEVTPGTHDVVLPCNIKANQATALYTRTSGYLKKWNFDIGQHIEAGQVMAEIEAPEIEAQLKQSQASLEQNEAATKKAEADKDLAQKTLDRYLDAEAISPGSVTQQAIDQNQSALKDADAALNQAGANVAAAKANVQQLQTQVGFEKVIAPFSGTVTARNYDVGALLSPTNNSAGSEIFDLAQTDPLRVFVNVPQEYSNDIKMKESAKLYIRNFPTRAFEGVVVATAGAVDPNTRTLSVQINFPNPKGELFAGEYGEIHLPVTDPETIGLIPTSALIFNAQANGNQVAVVNGDKTIHMKKVKTGRDFGTTIEVTDGLTRDDKVVTNPSERVSEGAKVTALEAPKAAPATKPAAQPSH